MYSYYAYSEEFRENVKNVEVRIMSLGECIEI